MADSQYTKLSHKFAVCGENTVVMFCCIRAICNGGLTMITAEEARKVAIQNHQGNATMITCETCQKETDAKLAAKTKARNKTYLRLAKKKT